ncbi:MAG TPA: hypothetical protein VEH02_11400, partial [Pseudolabrys sp.]|nr:hypothetical protein [Pseudolabrys sp.]
MNAREIMDELASIAASREFRDASAELMEEWVTAGYGIEAVAPILEFMEQHPYADYGLPGP